MKGSKREKEQCQNYCPALTDATLPDTRIALPLRRLWWQLKRYVYHISVLGPIQFTKKTFCFKVYAKRTAERKQEGFKAATTDEEHLNLQPGELVEVRSEKEIFATLDHEGKLNGLRFNPEMRKYCGGRFGVYRRLEKIILETTGELRTVRTPTVLLEGVFCDGEAHGGCDRSCFCFWREAWLKRVTPQYP